MGESLDALWYVVATKPNQEHFAETNLVNLGVESFCPRIQQFRKIRRRETLITAPLFPGYVFAKACLGTHYRAIVYARGVRHLITFGGMPATVGPDIIDTIRAKTVHGYIKVPRLALAAGTPVRIENGPLQGIEAVFEREMSGQQRALVLLKSLAYQAHVVVDLRDVAYA